jgi:hypothetical protein
MTICSVAFSLSWPLLSSSFNPFQGWCVFQTADLLNRLTSTTSDMRFEHRVYRPILTFILTSKQQKKQSDSHQINYFVPARVFQVLHDSFDARVRKEKN